MTASLPNELQVAIEHAQEAVERHPDHALLPSYRWAIYRELGPITSSRTGQIRARLALLSAQRALQEWTRVRPDDQWPEQLLQLAEKVFDGELTVTAGRAAAEEAFDQLVDRIAQQKQPDSASLSTEVQAAVLAAIEALFEASGTYTFETANVYEGKTDSDLDPWSADAALHAANAYAGPIWEPTSDIVKREEFWIWWLSEAIPMAWETGNQTKGHN